jgi:cobalt transporter subunit CbtB
MNTASHHSSVASTVHFARWQGLAVLLAGIIVVFAAGFSHPTAIHNATHDTRHAFGLPCH